MSFGAYVGNLSFPIPKLFSMFPNIVKTHTKKKHYSFQFEPRVMLKEKLRRLFLCQVIDKLANLSFLTSTTSILRVSII